MSSIKSCKLCLRGDSVTWFHPAHSYSLQIMTSPRPGVSSPLHQQQQNFGRSQWWRCCPAWWVWPNSWPCNRCQPPQWRLPSWCHVCPLLHFPPAPWSLVSLLGWWQPADDTGVLSSVKCKTLHVQEHHWEAAAMKLWGLCLKSVDLKHEPLVKRNKFMEKKL